MNEHGTPSFRNLGVREHPAELIEQAVVLPHGHFVCLKDVLFEQHGLGPRYAQVITLPATRHGQELSYAYLDHPETTYDLIIQEGLPKDLGSLETLISQSPFTKLLFQTFTERCRCAPTPQQLALAHIKRKAENLQIEDELGRHRVAKWALVYEKRAHWICKNRIEAFSKERIDWPSQGL